jgi:cell division septation protein DedD
MATAAPTPLASGDAAYLYRAAIGPRGQDYYLRQFARFDADGKAGTSWNWAAYWGTVNWMAYRRMWGWALAYVAAVLGLALLIFGVGKLVLDYSQTTAWLLFLLLLTLAFVVPGLYANAWFYTHLNEKITAALRGTPELKDAATRLAAQAPDQRRLWLLGLGNAVVLAVVLSVLNWLQGSDSALPQLAAREERLQSAVPRPAAAPAVAAPASAPVPAASVAVATAASAPAAAPASPASDVAEPAVAVAASAPIAAQPAVVSTPLLLPAVDRSTAVAARPVPAPAPAQAAPRADSVTGAAPAAAGSRPASVRPRPVYVWVIQVGAYAEDGNVKNALAQVQALGLEAGAESFDAGAKGRLTRVRVGPFARQAEAEQAALRIRSLNLPVLVIRQRP